MRLSDTTLLGVMGLAAAAVLVATAGGMFADAPPAAEPAAAISQPLAPVALTPSVPAAPVATAPASSAPEPAPRPLSMAAPLPQGEWRLPDQVEVKAARPPAGAGELPALPAVFTPAEQQAAWAARDQLANAGRAARPAPVAALTRPHEGAAPDKQAVGR